MSKILNEILKSNNLYCKQSDFVSFLYTIFEKSGKSPADKPTLPILYYNGSSVSADKAQSSGKNIAIVPIHGLMTKYSDWWNYGIEEIAEYIVQLYHASDVEGLIVDYDTGGGTMGAIIELENVFAIRNKPVFAFINSNCYSAGIYTAMFTDGIFSVNEKCGVGSIGVMTRVIDDSKLLENWGIVVREIYPPESKFKNKAINEAIAGKDKLLIEEVLSPMAVMFQNTVKKFRPDLDLTVEGIIEGKDFFAYQASNYKLIDGIKTLPEMIQYALNYTTGKSIQNLLT